MEKTSQLKSFQFYDPFTKIDTLFQRVLYSMEEGNATLSSTAAVRSRLSDVQRKVFPSKQTDASK